MSYHLVVRQKRGFTFLGRDGPERVGVAPQLENSHSIQLLSYADIRTLRHRLLLLDEPSMGLAPALVSAIFQTLREINSAGVTILLVEQNARQAFALANRGYVLETGAIILTGPGEELRSDSRVKEAYWGYAGGQADGD